MKRLINHQPGRLTGLALGLLPFVLLLAVYALGSDARLAENPDDKLLPSFTSFGETIQRMAFEPSKRTGEILLWEDTRASLGRLATGVGVSALIGLVFGIALGAVPLVRAGLAPLVASLSLIPPMALLPILFIVFGLGELSKVVLIVFGTAPFIVRDLQQRVQELPRELIVKAQTLAGNSWQIILRVILPQVLPRLIDAVRLSLGAAWLFLIAAEAIASTEGLGYRIFLVRRYLAMDVILPYVVWITLLAYLTDFLLRQISRLAFPWYGGGAKEGA
jgi:NitT/TauT family transport system permease protein